jgi:hypothetical protein
MDSDVRRSLQHVAFDPGLTAGNMILVAGPRQAGKTTFARAWLGGCGCEALYYTWGSARVRRASRGRGDRDGGRHGDRDGDADGAEYTLALHP